MRITLLAWALILSIFATGCASSSADKWTDYKWWRMTLVNYQSTERMSFKDASAIVEELSMMQHPDFRPSSIVIKENYILWVAGIKSSGGVAINGAVNMETHDASERIYFNSIEKIEIYQKKDWYYVLIHCKNIDKYAYLTQDLNEAKRFVDALETLRSGSKASLTGQIKPTQKAGADTYT